MVVLSSGLPPGPEERFPGEFFLRLYHGVFEFLDGLNGRYGEIAHFTLGRSHFFAVSDAESARQILGSRSGEFSSLRPRRAASLFGQGVVMTKGLDHALQTRLVAEAFHPDRIAPYCDYLLEHVHRCVAGWKERREVDLFPNMIELTVPLFSRIFFDYDLEGRVPEVSGIVRRCLKLQHLAQLPLVPFLERVRNKRFHASLERLKQLVLEMIDDVRSREPRDSKNLFSILDDHLEGEELLDHLRTYFILVGHDSTAAALTWTWYLLAQNPESERRLQQEVDEVLGSRMPTLEDVPRLSYTKNVFSEILRLYPPVWLLARYAPEETSIGGYHVPRSSIFLLNQYALHRSPRYYDEPERFHPDRWSADPRRTDFSYLPFGGGPRWCRGSEIVVPVAVLLLSTLAARWKISASSRRPVKPHAHGPLRPQFFARFEERDRPAR